MALITVEDAKLTLGIKPLFEGLNFSINEGDQVGLVGNNGCGKTSLIRAIMGEHKLDSGIITKKRGIRIGYVPQEVPEAIEEQTCHEYLVKSIPPISRDSDFWKADVALSNLGLLPELWDKPVKALSGGWRRLLLIASAILNDPDLLILDEPTNHLDLGKIFHLEKWVKESVAVPFLMVSHDREFLDNCTKKTLFMRKDGVHQFGAAFSIARENLLQADALAARQHHREDQEIRRLERSALRLREWSNKKGINPDLARKARAVRTRAEHLKAKQTQYYKEDRRDIKLHTSDVDSNVVAVIQNTVIETPDGRTLFSIERLQVKRGDRIVLLGENGTGKSMFIKRLIEEFENYTPGPGHLKEFYFNPQLRLGYLDQHLERLPQGIELFSFLSRGFELDRTQTTRELANIGFPANQQTKNISDLSSGEQARLALLVLRLSKPNFYVLDEPTNHLDIQGQEDLESELDDKEHTCIFVSHDRRLVRGASTRFFEIDGDELVEVEGVDHFFAKLKAKVNGNDEPSLSEKEQTQAPSRPKAKKNGLKIKGRQPK